MASCSATGGLGSLKTAGAQHKDLIIPDSPQSLQRPPCYQKKLHKNTWISLGGSAGRRKSGSFPAWGSMAPGRLASPRAGEPCPAAPVEEPSALAYLAANRQLERETRGQRRPITSGRLPNFQAPKLVLKPEKAGRDGWAQTLGAPESEEAVAGGKAKEEYLSRAQQMWREGTEAAGKKGDGPGSEAGNEVGHEVRDQVGNVVGNEAGEGQAQDVGSGGESPGRAAQVVASENAEESSRKRHEVVEEAARRVEGERTGEGLKEQAGRVGRQGRGDAVAAKKEEMEGMENDLTKAVALESAVESLEEARTDLEYRAEVTWQRDFGAEAEEAERELHERGESLEGKVRGGEEGGNLAKSQGSGNLDVDDPEVWVEDVSEDEDPEFGGYAEGMERQLEEREEKMEVLRARDAENAPGDTKQAGKDLNHGVSFNETEAGLEVRTGADAVGESPVGEPRVVPTAAKEGADRFGMPAGETASSPKEKAEASHKAECGEDALWKGDVPEEDDPEFGEYDDRLEAELDLREERAHVIQWQSEKALLVEMAYDALRIRDGGAGQVWDRFGEGVWDGPERGTVSEAEAREVADRYSERVSSLVEMLENMAQSLEEEAENYRKKAQEERGRGRTRSSET